MKKTIYLLFITILVLITVALVFAAVTSRTNESNKDTSKQQAYAALSFSPEKLTVISASPSARQVVDIMIDTDNKDAFGAQIELQYDPAIISNVEFEKPADPFFGTNSDELINTSSLTEGRATYAVGINPSDDEKKGRGTVVRVTFRIITVENKETEIKILPTSSINNLDDEGSILKNSATLPIAIISQ